MLPIQYHLQRQLAVFEECASINDRTEREACCDKNVDNEGGREFCYKELNPDKDKFFECDEPSYADMHECCDKFAEGDEDLAYHCKTSLPGEGKCFDVISCKENYDKALRWIEHDRRFRELVLNRREGAGKTDFRGYSIVGVLFLGLCIAVLCTVYRRKKREEAARKSKTLTEE